MASSSLPAPAPDVIALFGPTASGKSAVAARLGDVARDEPISADSAALYAGLPILTAAPEQPTPARRHRARSPSRCRSAGTSRAHTRRSTTILAAVEAGRSSSEARACTCAPRSRSCRCGRRPSRASAAAGRTPTAGSAPEGAHALLAERDPRPPPACIRTTASGSCGHSSWPRRGTRSPPSATTSGAHDFRLPTLLVALDAAARRARPAHRRPYAHWRRTARAAEARRAWTGPLSPTRPRRCSASRRSRRCPSRRRSRWSSQATKRLARYQRKWLRRLPGVATLDACRPVEEIADEISALAGAAERLPRH